MFKILTLSSGSCFFTNSQYFADGRLFVVANNKLIDLNNSFSLNWSSASWLFRTSWKVLCRHIVCSIKTIDFDIRENSVWSKTLDFNIMLRVSSIFSLIHDFFEFDDIVDTQSLSVFLGEIKIDNTSAISNLSLQESKIFVFIILHGIHWEDLANERLVVIPRLKLINCNKLMSWERTTSWFFISLLLLFRSSCFILRSRFSFWNNFLRFLFDLEYFLELILLFLWVDIFWEIERSKGWDSKFCRGNAASVVEFDNKFILCCELKGDVAAEVSLIFSQGVQHFLGDMLFVELNFSINFACWISENS